MDPFEARFTFFWYNDREIFHDSQEEMDAKIRKVAEQGITHIITFSCTHFRWSYRPWWDRINACLAKIVTAAHRCGIRVIEHHSAELTSYPDTPERLDRMRRYLNDRGSSADSWPGIVPMLLAPDSPALAWAQISGKTLQVNVTGYAATGKCYNNPEYRREYLKYLESVYATGVDGIMTDDVQYYCHCRCAHCTRLFREKYGYELPPPEKWDAWFGNMRDPSFLAWLRFRFDSTHAFHEVVAAHYEAMGLKLLRPNYLSFAITRDWTAFSVETVPRMDWFFQECARSCVIRYSWLKVLSEQTHRAMVARARGIPHGILFYAYDPEQLLFSWGISMVAGAFYINTPEGKSREVNEKVIRDFEKAHAAELFHAEPMAEVGFLDSRENRFFSAGYEMSRMEFWMQACILHNIPVLMLDAGRPESWRNCRTICVNEVNILSEAQIAELKRFAEEGGSLILSGIPGNQEESGRERTPAEVERLWGISLRPPSGEKTHVVSYGAGRICVTDISFGYPGPESEIQAMFGRNHMDFPYGEMPFELLKQIGFICANTIRTGNCAVPSNVGTLYRGLREKSVEICTLIRSLAPGKTFRTELPELMLAAPFRSKTERSITLRILNAGGTLAPPGDGKAVSHDDPIPWRDPGEGIGRIVLALPEGMEDAVRAELFLPSGAREKLQCRRQDGMLEVRLPCGFLKTFAMVKIV